MQGGVLSLVHEGKCIATAKRGPNGAAPSGSPWLLRFHISASWIDAPDRDYLDRLNIPRTFSPNLKTVGGKREARKELNLLGKQLDN